ncbi:hypothetical protein D3C83_16620 [compost metagenome]
MLRLQSTLHDCFPEETLGGRRVPGHGGIQELDRDVRAPPLGGAIHLAHCAASDDLRHPVVLGDDVIGEAPELRSALVVQVGAGFVEKGIPLLDLT